MSERKHLDETWLREQYIEECRPVPDITEECDVVAQTVYDAMDRFGIERDPTRYGDKNRAGYATYYIDQKGYPRWQSKGREDGERVTDNFHVHRLLAIAKFGVEAVVGKDVHHLNGVPWDNRPANIELRDPGEHSAEHNRKLSYLDWMAIQEQYENTDLSQRQLGEIHGVSQSTVRRVVQWFEGNITAGDRGLPPGIDRGITAEATDPADNQTKISEYA